MTTADDDKKLVAAIVSGLVSGQVSVSMGATVEPFKCSVCGDSHLVCGDSHLSQPTDLGKVKFRYVSFDSPPNSTMRPRRMSLLNNDDIRKITSLPYHIGAEAPEVDPATSGMMEIIDSRAGDLKIIWDRSKPAEVDAAMETFEALRAQGYTAFLVKDKDGKQGDKVTSFDPNAERLIFIAPLAGG
jgi:hypothetical protein